MTKRLRVGEALIKAKKLLNTDAVILPTHVYDRMRERNFEMDDIINVFNVGKISKQPEWNADYRQWEYVVDGVDIEDEKLSVVFAFTDDDELVIKTGKRPQRWE